MKTRHERLPEVPPPDLETAGIIRQGWSAYARNATAIVLMNVFVAGVSIACMAPFDVGKHVFGKNFLGSDVAYSPTLALLTTFTFVGMIAIAILSAYFTAGLYRAYLKAVRGGRVSFRDLFSGGKYWGSVLLASILVGFYILGGLLLFVIPGLYFTVVLVLTPFFIVDKGKYSYPAMHASWNAAKPYWREFLPVLLVIVVAEGISFGVSKIPYAGYVGTAASRLVVGPVATCCLAVIYDRLTARTTA